jgi:carboxyl-terminal processing protease
MKTSRMVFLLFSVALLLPVISGSLSRASTEERGSSDSLSKNLSVFSEVLSLIRRAYVEETSMEELLEGALDGSSDALDPMATYVPVANVEHYREVRRIGRQHSGLTVAKDRGIVFVVAVDADSPGAEAGLKQGDILAKIDDLSTRRMPLWRVQSALAAEPGTDLALEVLRRGQTHDLTLTLENYETQPLLMETIEGQRMIRMTRFEQQDLAALRGMLAGLLAEDVDQLLIDVRGVAGGDAGVAYAMAGLLVEGSLGELRSRDEATIHFHGQAAPIWQGETVILINNGTQGAGEIFATVLRQLGESQLVGRSSFGLAGRQRLVPLSDGSQLLLTDAFYRGPDGEPINQGLVPDVRVVDFGQRVAEDEEAVEDLTLEKGLELLRASEEDAREVA